MKKIYLLHEYGEPSHFKALYDHADKYGTSVSRQIILSYKAIAWRTWAGLKKEGMISASRFLIQTMFDHFSLYFLRDEILIVGIAPYDYLLNRYKRIFKRNKTYYFTSHTRWDGTDIPRGDIKNKKTFESLLRSCFIGAFCVSEETEKQVRKFFRRTSVVNHGIDYDKYKKRPDRADHVRKYIFVGQFIERKNIRLILTWLKDHPDARLRFSFVGRGKLGLEIDELAKVDARVSDRGHYTKEQLQESLSEYDFLVLPSKEEPYGIVLLEALAAGVPCIVSNTIGPKEIIEDGVTGWIFDLDMENGFDLAMKKSICLSDAELNVMRHNAEEKGKQYDTKEIVKKWIRLLE